MEEKLESILSKLQSIESRLAKLEGDASCIKKSCHSMDDHINFIDRVYSKLRYPLDWLASKFTGKKASLPSHPLSAAAIKDGEDIVECENRLVEICSDSDDDDDDRLFSL